MANKYLKRCSMSSAMRETKTALSFSLTLAGMATLRIGIQTKCRQRSGGMRRLYVLLVGMWDDETATEISMDICERIKSYDPAPSFLCVYTLATEMPTPCVHCCTVYNN